MKRSMIFPIALGWTLAFLFSLKGYAQTTKAKEATTDNPPAVKTGLSVRLDLKSGAFLDPLPFDTPFKIVGVDYDASLISVKCFIAQGTTLADATDLWASWKKRDGIEMPFLLAGGRASDATDVITSHIRELKPNKHYTFKFQINRTLNAEEAKSLKAAVVTRLSAILNKRLEGKLNFELTKTDITTAAKGVIEQAKNSLKPKGLKLNANSLPDTYYDAIKGSLLDLTNLYEQNFHTPVQAVAGSQPGFTTALHKLVTVTAKEKGFTETESFKTLVNSLRTLTARPIDPNRVLPAADLNSLQTAVKAALESTKSSPAPKSASYTSIEPDLIDALQYVDQNLATYMEAPTIARPAIEQSAQQAADLLAQVIVADITLDGDTYGTYEARANFYLSADIGLAFFPDLGKASPYLGTNIYFRPVNKQRPIYKGDYNPFRSFSLLIGISFMSVAETNKRGDLLTGSLNLIAGAGYRVTDHIRLNGGWIFYNKIDPNPLLKSSKLGYNGFISLSFDWDINSVFKRFFKPTIPAE